MVEKPQTDQTPRGTAVCGVAYQRQHQGLFQRPYLSRRDEKSLRARAELLFLPRRYRRVSFGFTSKRIDGIFTFGTTERAYKESINNYDISEALNKISLSFVCVCVYY